MNHTAYAFALALAAPAARVLRSDVRVVVVGVIGGIAS